MEVTGEPTSVINVCFPGGSEVKVSAYNAGDLGSIPGSGRSPGEGNGRKWQHTPVFLPGESHGWRSLVGYSPLGRKELDTTELLHPLPNNYYLMVDSCLIIPSPTGSFLSKSLTYHFTTKFFSRYLAES